MIYDKVPAQNIIQLMKSGITLNTLIINETTQNLYDLYLQLAFNCPCLWLNLDPELL